MVPPSIQQNAFLPRCLAAAVAVFCLTSELPQAAGADDAFARKIAPLLRAYCFDCHGSEVQENAIDLSEFTDAHSLQADPELWSAVLEQIASHSMPPEESLQPTDEERRQLVDWLTERLDRWAEQAPRDPGRVTMRRLNRREYNNTLRDLFGIDLQLADRFPADDVRGGFDNNGDALTLPPILLEKYLDAADRVLDETIVSEDSLQPVEIALRGDALRSAVRRRRSETPAESTHGAALGLDHQIVCQLDEPPAGRYRVRFRASISENATEPATVVLRVDGIDLALLLVDSSQSDEFEAMLPLSAGAKRLALHYTPAKAGRPEDDAPTPPTLHIEELEVAGPARVLSHRRIFFVQPGGGRSDTEAAREVLERFASRAFRRPVDAAELEHWIGLYQKARASGRTFVQAIRIPLWSILVSPHFLFLVESDPPSSEDAPYFLNDYEIASRLSYFLWSSMPDETLFQLAEKGRLREPDYLVAEVDRMLADPRAESFVANFVSQWLGLEKLTTLERDAERFPEFTESLRRAMQDEPRMLFDHILREDRSLLELLTADYTFANAPLAQLYGLKADAGQRMRQLALPDARRGGVLTTAAVLTATSLPTRTSPVNRGKWILEEILGAPPPPPPPDVPELDQQAEQNEEGRSLTLRERLEQHRADPQCASCHRRMDVLGLGLENYDAIGRWRDDDAGQTIDAAGTLPEGDSFTDPGGLKSILADRRDAFARTLTEKMLAYAIGRDITRSDRGEIKRIVERVAEDDYRLRRLINEVVRSDAFRMRRAADRFVPQEP